MMTSKDYSIPAIHCKHCAHTIKMELTDLDGVQDVAVDIDNKSIRVDYEHPATERIIEDLLKEIDYPAEK